MQNSNDALYVAFVAKDARFDGRFFVGISSTGIYCRPVCSARQPKPQNCTFFTSAAQAEQAGYRPCLLCRPELAPGVSRVDATANLVYRAARMLEQNCGNGQSLKEIAERLGCTDRHLRRVFTAEYNVSPVRYRQTCRLLLAKNLLTDTDVSVLEVAMAAGFGSLRRFNDVFKKQYHLSPTALRKKTKERKNQNSEVTFSLGYRPPYGWDKLLHFLAKRAIAGVELAKDNTYWRTVQLNTTEGKQVSGWIRVGHIPQRHALAVTVSESLLPVLPEVMARVRHLFDLYCEPEAVYQTLQAMNTLRPGLCVPGTRVPGCFDAFEMAVRAVLGQQITVKAAGTLAARIARTYGTAVQTGIEGLCRVFPTTKDVLEMGETIQEKFGELGVTSARSQAILALAKEREAGSIRLDISAQPEEEMAKLSKIPGIGSWTAQYIAMRAMEWPDAFLETDAGVKKALGPHTAKKLLQMAEAWRPWRSYATVNLWNSL